MRCRRLIASLWAYRRRPCVTCRARAVDARLARRRVRPWRPEPETILRSNQRRRARDAWRRGQRCRVLGCRTVLFAASAAGPSCAVARRKSARRRRRHRRILRRRRAAARRIRAPPFRAARRRLPVSARLMCPTGRRSSVSIITLNL